MATLPFTILIMVSESEIKIPVCQHKTTRIARQQDGEAFYRMYSGGMRAAEPKDGVWQIEPILHQGHPSAKCFLQTEQLGAFFAQYGFKFVAFNRIIWSNGVFHSSWRPVIIGQTNHMRGPADLWSSIASNLSERRTKNALADMGEPKYQKIAAILDNHTEAERLALSISLSLRSMDISAEQITEIYNEQLVNHMASGCLSGERVANLTLDQNLWRLSP